jgi:hypothetical protein
MWNLKNLLISVKIKRFHKNKDWVCLVFEWFLESLVEMKFVRKLPKEIEIYDFKVIMESPNWFFRWIPV